MNMYNDVNHFSYIKVLSKDILKPIVQLDSLIFDSKQTQTLKRPLLIKWGILQCKTVVSISILLLKHNIKK